MTDQREPRAWEQARGGMSTRDLYAAINLLSYRPIVHEHAINVPGSAVLSLETRRSPQGYTWEASVDAGFSRSARFEFTADVLRLVSPDAWNLRSLSQAQLDSLSVALDHQHRSGAGNALV